jgi:hypothetical protein
LAEVAAAGLESGEGLSAGGEHAASSNAHNAGVKCFIMIISRKDQAGVRKM